MPSINKCILFLALSLSVSAFGTSGHDARAHHHGMARHIQRNPSLGMNMIAPNPLRKRQTTRNNTARCKASQEQASSASVSSASVASVSSASAAASKSSAAAASSSAAAAASKSSEHAKPSPTSDSSGNNNNNNNNGGNSNSGLTTGGVGTYYLQDGVAGACGDFHSDDDIICALQTKTYAGGNNCGKMVAITNDLTKKTVNVLVADECPTCDNSMSIDLSKGAFHALGGTTEEGEFPISWKFI